MLATGRGLQCETFWRWLLLCENVCCVCSARFQQESKKMLPLTHWPSFKTPISAALLSGSSLLSPWQIYKCQQWGCTIKSEISDSKQCMNTPWCGPAFMKLQSNPVLCWCSCMKISRPTQKRTWPITEGLWENKKTISNTPLVTWLSYKGVWQLCNTSILTTAQAMSNITNQQRTITNLCSASQPCGCCCGVFF